VVTGEANSSDSRLATFIAWISPDRKEQTIIRVWPYVPWSTAISADGVIWGVGYVLDDANRSATDNVIRRYDRSGAMIESIGTQAKANPVYTGSDVTMGSYLMASRSAVGWVTNGGQYIEYALNGKELARFDAPAVLMTGVGPQTCGAALGDGGETLICTDRGGTGSEARVWQALALDRKTRTWSAAFPEQAGEFSLAGFDGDEPVTLESRDGGVMGRYTPKTATQAKE
jgi:hypothetical protein